MKATPEDVAKHPRPHRNQGDHTRLNEGHARRRGEVDVYDQVQGPIWAASMKATPEDVAKSAPNLSSTLPASGPQ